MAEKKDKETGLLMRGNRVQISITLQPETAKKLSEVADRTGRTRSGLAGWLIKEGLKDLIWK